ncbi:DUF4406 domain-containing protein [Micropruina sp.]|uniref:DUF4406 domain-containing protein n=1 Tax=Micropruina sp. TaxID=2737536 RepID=UPI0039E2DEFF
MRLHMAYICGPMAGHADLNEPAFRAAAATIRGRGDIPLVPHDIPPHVHVDECAAVYGEKGAQGEGGSEVPHDGGCYLRADLAELLRQGDYVYRLPGWSRSRGAQIECLIARLLHIPIEDAPGAEAGGSPIEALALLADEIRRQDAKWGQQNHPDGTSSVWSVVADRNRKVTDRLAAAGRVTWRHILVEEVTEAIAEQGDQLSDELVQVGAVASQWIAARERRVA